jgi:hypothetical protein
MLEVSRASRSAIFAVWGLLLFSALLLEVTSRSSNRFVAVIAAASSLQAVFLSLFLCLSVPLVATVS